MECGRKEVTQESNFKQSPLEDNFESILKGAWGQFRSSQMSPPEEWELGHLYTSAPICSWSRTDSGGPSWSLCTKQSRFWLLESHALTGALGLAV